MTTQPQTLELLTPHIHQKNLEKFAWTDVSDLKKRINLAQVIDIAQKITKSKVIDSIIIKNYNNRQHESFFPKTEASYLDIPPKYIAVFGTGSVSLVNIYNFLLQLTEQEQLQLISLDHRFISNNGTKKTIAPIVQFPKYNDILFRFSCSAIEEKIFHYDHFLKHMCEYLLAYFEENQITIKLQSNSLLILNNWQLIHMIKPDLTPDAYMQSILLTESI